MECRKGKSLVKGLEKISIVYVTDEKYVMPTCVSMLSVKDNLAKGCMAEAYVICDKVRECLSNSFLKLQDENFRLHIINVENKAYANLAKLCGSYGVNYVTASALFKFNICEILQEEDKVIYLDSDTLVLGNLAELYDIDLEEHYVAAVDDQLDKITDGQSSMAAKADICFGHYFNSGVMLFNLKKMREDKICTKLIDYRKHGKNYFMDQDTFNAVLKNNRKMLPYKYNFMTTCIDHYDVCEISERFFDGHQSSIDECIRCASIIHLTGKYKPWEYNIPWFSALFLKYYNKSPFSKEKIQLKSMTKVLQNAIDVGSKYIFPYEKIEKNEKIILYGAGRIGKMYYRQIMATGYCEIVGWVDSDYKNKNSLVQSPDLIKSTRFSKILIGIGAQHIAEEVEEFLVNKYQIDTKSIIIV